LLLRKPNHPAARELAEALATREELLAELSALADRNGETETALQSMIDVVSRDVRLTHEERAYFAKQFRKILARANRLARIAQESLARF